MSNACDECDGVGGHECWCALYVEPERAPRVAFVTIVVTIRTEEFEDGAFAPATERVVESSMQIEDFRLSDQQIRAELASRQRRGELVSWRRA